MKRGNSLVVWQLALACLVSGPAFAYESFALPQDVSGNMLGLAYRQSDGHFFTTQEADYYDAQLGVSVTKGLVSEFDRAGHLLQRVDLATLAPEVLLAESIWNTSSSPDFFVQTAHYDPQTDQYQSKVYKLSADLKSMTDVGVPSPLANLEFDGYQITSMTDTSFYAHDMLQGSSVVITSRETGEAHSIDLSAYNDTLAGCLEWNGVRSMCVRSVAPSWNGGFFLLNEGKVNEADSSYTSRLLEFDGSGKLVQAMEFDPKVYDYPPLAMAVDLVSHEVFISFNNHFVATVTEQQLRAGVLTVPEAGTWALWPLGAVMMSLAVKRRRSRQV